MKVRRCVPNSRANGSIVNEINPLRDGWVNVYEWGYGFTYSKKNVHCNANELLYRIRVIPKVKDKEALR